MSPTVRDRHARIGLEHPGARREPRGAVVYAWSLLGAALVGIGALTVVGASLPAPGPLLLLAIPLALCMNRYLFFPNEIGVTADAAVLFAAMVAFGGGATWLGPLVLAVLVGPLDARHWGARAWRRMAYNSGSTVMTTAAGLAAFVPLSHAFGSGWEATLGAAAVAVIPYVLVELGLGVALVALLGERPHDAIRHQLPLDALALPLALVGAVAGLAALDVGWWLSGALLLPVAFVPEIVFVALPRRRCDRSAVIAAASGALVVASLFATDIGASLSQLAALALLAGAECRVAPRVPIPLLGVPVAIAAAIVAPADVRVVAIPVVVLAALVAAWWCAAPGGPRWHVESLFWSTPLFAVAAFAAALWVEWRSVGVLVFATLMTFALVVTATWGATPWRSRHIVRWVMPWAARIRWVLLLIALATSVVAGAVAVLVGGDEHGGAYLAAAAVEIALAAAAVAVRQWRFAPERRRRDGLLVAAVAIAVAIVGSPPQRPSPFVTAGAVVVGASLAIGLLRPLDRLDRARA